MAAAFRLEEPQALDRLARVHRYDLGELALVVAIVLVVDGEPERPEHTTVRAQGQTRDAILTFGHRAGTQVRIALEQLGAGGEPERLSRADGVEGRECGSEIEAHRRKALERVVRVAARANESSRCVAV